ncbi:C2 calcium/lipid-binding region-containing protein [Heterostelium album PN500]|uniref:C2 calcium/lipid-binding region-containing protein n=1 Tax=Heterostelium pallidum (strain ATCC 26659 / Pp 5 / PN500) TaxID=670386 RepID=D3AXR8_HETP5|nr:C2 calcium/lipid-binding region-containing protein [Heterostelium album PN500]EFA85745.1 C2 calcium/lipid-binding region-containing protein [Heterostelium album PN500]|eukprot:XP_020437851.1 C2 calcium/lipid-binding region-containing protein [Heterostelium album PN500]
MGRSHKGKDKFKKVANLKEYNGGSLFVSWRRGNSKLQGETSHVIVRNAEATFEEKITFESKFFIDSKSQKPDEKKFSMTLKEEKKKSSSGKVLGKIELDLTSYMNYKSTQPVNLSFSKGIKPEPILTCTFNTIPLKYNDKPLVKVLNKETSSKDPRLVKTISGEDYFLDKTDSASDTSVDHSQSSDISFNDSFGDDDPNDDLGESKKELRAQIDQLTKERDLADNEAFERLQKMKEMETEIENLKKQYKILQEDIDYKEKLIESIQNEKDNLINQQLIESSKALNSSNGMSEIEVIKQEKLEKMTIIANQEKEIAKLKKQVKQSQLSNSELGSLTGADIRSKYTSLQQENEEMEKTIAKLEKEISQMQEKLSVGIIPTSKKNDAFNGNNSSNEIGVVTTKSGGSVDELRRQSQSYKQELDEKTLVERTIFLAEPQFKGNLAVSGIHLFDGLVAQGILKDNKSGTRLFSSIGIALETTLKKCTNDNNLLAYWLSTSCLLLAKIEAAQQASSDDKAGLSPISSFEYQLKATIFKFYSRLIHNTYARISPILMKSILQHDIHAFNSGRLQKRKSAPDIPSLTALKTLMNGTSSSPAILSPSTSKPNSTGSAASNNNNNNNNSSIRHNQFNSNSLLDILQEFYEILRHNYVHANLITQFFSQIFFYTNALLLNSLNSINGLCSTANGFQMRIELSKIQDWVALVNLEESIVQLQQMFEITNLLVMDKKLVSDADVLEQVIASLQPHHVRHILTLFQTDQINGDPIPSGVMKAIEHIIAKSGEQQPETYDIDLTYMNQLSLDFLKDSSYRASDRREIGRTNTSNSLLKR